MAVLFFALLPLLARPGEASPSQVEVWVEGQLLLLLSLDQEGTFPVRYDGEERMQIQIQRGTVRVTQSTCPQKLCMQHGPLSHPWDVIVCLPGKILVRFRPPSHPSFQGEFDLVTR